MVGPVDEQQANDILAFVDEMQRRRVASFLFEPETGYLKVEFLPPEPPERPPEAKRRPLETQERDELDTLRQRLRREEEALSAS